MEIEKTKKKILTLLNRVEREGIGDLIENLEQSDFFIAPASIRHHLAVPGGLALHSLNVYRLLFQRMNFYYRDKWIVPAESVILCSLLHDACKINYYVQGASVPLTAAMKYRLNKDFMAYRDQINSEDRKKFIAYVFDEKKQVKDIPKEVGSALIDWLGKNPQNTMPDLPHAYKIEDACPLGHGEKSLSYIQDFIRLTDIEKQAIRWHMGAWDISPFYGKYSYDVAEKEPFVVLLQLCDYEASHLLDWKETRQKGEE